MFVRVWINKDWYHDFDNGEVYETGYNRLEIRDKNGKGVGLFSEWIFVEYIESKEDGDCS